LNELTMLRGYPVEGVFSDPAMFAVISAKYYLHLQLRDSGFRDLVLLLYAHLYSRREIQMKKGQL